MEENTNKMKIELEKHAEFDATAETLITNTDEICKMINDIFHAVFADYYGCSLTVQYQDNLHMNIIVPKLLFRVLKKEDYDDNKVYGFKTLGVEGANNMVGRVMRVSQSVASGVKVFMTDEAKEMLEEFMITPNSFMKPAKFDWTTCFNVQPSESGTFVVMFKLDIVKLITKIFGDVDENNDKQYYQIMPMYPVSTNQYKTLDKWALNVMRLHHSSQAHAAEMVGMFMPQSMNGPIAITATTTSK